MNKSIRITAILSLLLLGACTSLPVELGSRSNQPLPPKNAVARPIEAEACGWNFLIIGSGMRDHAARAYQDLLAKAAGDYIADVQVEESWTSMLFVRSWCTSLKAQAYRLSR